ncbi:MAG: PilZ domain-containing protein [Planctomycetota bacterium]|nr:PilZ domain-containing protein [Planctomycetota bacterium]
MTDRGEKREHRRLDAHYDISCRIVGSTDGKSYNGRTANVSSGGLYFETATEEFERGDLLKLELMLPPTSGLLEFGGKIAAFAKVLRMEVIRDDTVGANLARGEYGVALKFCRPLRLCQ